MLAALVWWIVVGLIAGFLAGLVMRGGGFGIVGDIVVGILGACLLIALLRAFSGSYTRRTL